MAAVDLMERARSVKERLASRPVEFEPWPYYDDEDQAAVLRVLRSGRVNYWTGEEGRRFEEEYAAYLGLRYAVAVANGTVALELALSGLGLAPGAEVVVPSRTFIATASAVVACGATPVVCDVDADSGNITAETVLPALTPRTRAVVAVHLAGWPCDMTGLLALCADRGLLLVEDCAQAHGASWRARKVGAFGDAAGFSFCQDKIMSTCGEGGMVVTGDEYVWRRAWERKDHGRSLDAVRAAEAVGGPAYKPLYESFGTNERMTEVQAAVGRVQLKRLDGWIESRRRNAGVLDGRLSAIDGVRVPDVPDAAHHAYYKYYAYLERKALKSGWTRDRVVAAVNDAGVPCSTGICPEIYLERAFQDAGLAPARRFPVARDLGETSLMLLVHPTLREEHMHRAADVLEHVMAEARK